MPSEPQAVRATAQPLPAIADEGFAAAFDRYAEARVVLLGECSHGTHEFYAARAAITRRLVERHGFTVVALEADWPDAASLDRRVRGRPEPAEAEPSFQRFPAWMWRNAEVDAFIEALAARNAAAPPERRAGVYGLDLYNLQGSMRAVVDYLEGVDAEAAQVARQRYGCLTPWAEAPQAYGRMATTSGYARCEEPVVRMLQDLNAERMRYAEHDAAGFLDAAANARLVRDAERYYRAMYAGSAESWNVRDRHMFDTLCALLEHGGPDTKAVVWAHNSHIGDARATDMGWSRDELNIGQLCRERFGDAAALIGFGTHTGEVACADDWDEPMRIKRVNPSRPDSWERLMHDAGEPRFLLDLRDPPSDLRAALRQPRLQRFIGVIYRPDTERWSHYSECELLEQFDGYVWFDETRAVAAHDEGASAAGDDLYPSGF